MSHSNWTPTRKGHIHVEGRRTLPQEPRSTRRSKRDTDDCSRSSRITLQFHHACTQNSVRFLPETWLDSINERSGEYGDDYGQKLFNNQK